MDRYKHLPVLFTFNGTPIRVRPLFWLMVAGLVGLMAVVAVVWLPGYGWLVHVLVAVGGAVLGLLADIGHACAHTISAKLAKAPMDVILLGADMPRTLYFDNDVPPRAHIIRSLGGPVYSLVGTLTGGLAVWLITPDTPAALLALIWLLVNGALFLGSLAPLPIVDGGVILKWLLVQRGLPEERADQRVRSLALVLGFVVLAGAGVMALAQAWVLSGVLVGCSVLIFLVTAGVIK